MFSFKKENQTAGGKSPAPGVNGSMLSQRMHKDWTQGNILSNLLQISWPMAITQTLMSLGPTIDMIWVGKLGTDEIAAVGISGVVVMLAQGAMMGLTAGMRAMISRAVGAHDNEMAQRMAQHAIILSAAYAVFMLLVGIFLSRPILMLVTPSEEVLEIAAVYMKIQFIGGATIVFRMMMDAIMQASGDSVNPMQIAIVFRILHIILCPFLIFGSAFATTVFPSFGVNFSGWWPFAALGVAGAAYTSVITQSIGVLLGIRVLFGARSRLHVTFKKFQMDFSIIWRMVRIGMPALVSNIQRNLNQFILQVFMAPFGTIVLAAHTLVMRLEMLIFMPAMAFGMGAGVLVGQNLGAKQPARAEKSVWLATGMVQGFVILVSLAFFIWTIPVIRVFGKDPALDETARQFVHIAIVGWLAVGFQSVLMNALQSAGDTMPTMIISIVTTWVITLPLAYLLPKYTDWGVNGIRWAMAVSPVAAGILNVLYFRTGRWKTRRV